MPYAHFDEIENVLVSVDLLATLAPLELSQEDSADIALLHELRNDFAHFTPKGCSIDLEGLPRIVDKTLGLVEVLMQTDRVSYRMTGNKKRRIRDGVRTVRTVLGVAT